MERDEIKWDGWFDAGPDLPGLLAGPSAARCWPQKRAALDAASDFYLVFPLCSGMSISWMIDSVT